MLNEPQVVVMTGPPGSGKSTVASEVARGLGAAVLDLDSMTNPLVDVVMASLGAEDYSDARVADATRGPRYECLARVASDCVSAGVSVVLIAPFTTERADPVAWAALASRFEARGARVSLAWIRIDAALLAERIAGRGATRDAGKLAGLKDYIAGIDLGEPRAPHIELDGTQAPVDQARRLIAALGSHP